MSRYLSAAIVVLLLLPSCGRRADVREYELHGQVTGIAADGSEVTIRHDDIKGFMPAMTMPFKVREEAMIEPLSPGDLVRATLVVTDVEAYLSSVQKLGSAPLVDAPVPVPGADVVQVGDMLPNETLVDQEAHKRRLGSFVGSAAVITFTYTRCPLPTFCPLIDRHFAAIQKAVQGDPLLRGKVKLLSVTIDPSWDTPAVLKAHAESLGADPEMWTFLTGEETSVDRLGARFGLTVIREGTDAADITHSLRTAVVDAEGRIVKIYRGSDWVPGQILDDLRGMALH
jgi:protein SCO1